MKLNPAKLLAFSSATLVVLLIAYRILPEIVYDSAFQGDALFLAHLAWRDMSGYEPVIDYPHFYGGATAEVMAIAFRMFGTEFKSIDYGYVIFFAGVASLSLAVSYGRLRSHWAWLLLLVCSALILAPNDIEDGYRIFLTHSFLYNHVAYAIMLLATCFVLTKPNHNQIIDCAFAVWVGACLAVLILLKSTFAVFVIFFLMATMISTTKFTVLSVAVGLVAALLFLDPGLQRTIGSIDLLINDRIVAIAGGIEGRLRFAFDLVVFQAHFILMALIGLVWLWKHDSAETRRFTVSLVICMAGIGGSLLTMGGGPHLMLLPAIFVSLLTILDRLSDMEPSKVRLATIVTLAAAVPIIALAIVGTVRASWSAWDMRSASLINEGPAASYVVQYGREPEWSGLPVEDRISKAYARLTAEGQSAKDSALMYLVLAEGVRLLGNLEGVQRYGIVASVAGVEYSYPMRARPVISAPVWQTQEAIQKLDFEDVDIIIDPKVAGLESLFSDDMRQIMLARFLPCIETEIVTLFARRDVAQAVCDR